MKIFLAVLVIGLAGLGLWYWYSQRGSEVGQYISEEPLAAIEATDTPLFTEAPVYTNIPTPVVTIRPTFRPTPSPTPRPVPVFVTMNSVSGSSQYGVAAITAEANGQATVSFNLVGTAYNGTYQPAYIYSGTCTDLGEIVYPLNTLFGGSSNTTLNSSFNSLVSGSGSLAIVVWSDSGLRTTCGQFR